MDLLNSIRKRAKGIKGVVLLPECAVDERVKQASKYILKHKLSKIAVLGKPSDFDEDFLENKDFIIFDITKFPQKRVLADALYKLRANKGMTLDEAKKLINQPGYFSMMLLQLGLVDGIVAGATWSTADTLRPALQIIKTKPNSKLASGATLMLKQGKNPLLFSDVSLNINPTSEELATIANDTAEFYSKVLHKKPYVAMLSFSTLGSGKGELADKVRNATKLVDKKYAVMGEVQVDSALDKKTAIRKGVPKDIAGKANVLIFPNIDAGNIGYKLTARLGGYTAIGPIVLGLNKPVNDLSRGCTYIEIVDTVCITKLQMDNNFDGFRAVYLD